MCRTKVNKSSVTNAIVNFVINLLFCLCTFKSKKCWKSAKLDKKKLTRKKKEIVCNHRLIKTPKHLSAFPENRQQMGSAAWPLCLFADLSSSAVSPIVSVI